MSAKQFIVITLSGIIATVVATLIVQYFVNKNNQAQAEKNVQQDAQIAQLANRPVYVLRGRRFH